MRGRKRKLREIEKRKEKIGKRGKERGKENKRRMERRKKSAGEKGKKMGMEVTVDKGERERRREGR